MRNLFHSLTVHLTTELQYNAVLTRAWQAVSSGGFRVLLLMNSLITEAVVFCVSARHND
jgi:hypothetical protein